MFMVDGNTVNAQLAGYDTHFSPFLDQNHAGAATLCVRHGGRLQVEHAYLIIANYLDRNLTRNSLFRINCLSTLFTAAAVQSYCASVGAVFGLDTPISPGLLGPPFNMRPHGFTFPDARWTQITPRIILAHRAGFGATIDNLSDARGVSQRMASSLEPPGVKDFVADRMSSTLDYAPGSGSTFSAFGFAVLSAYVQQMTRLSYMEFLYQYLLSNPAFIGHSTFPPPASPPSVGLEVTLGSTLWRNVTEWQVPDGGRGTTVYDPRSNPGFTQTQLAWSQGGGGFFLEGVDGAAGLIASANALATLMEHFWIDGSPIRGPWTGASYTLYFTLYGTSAICKWYPDGLTTTVALVDTGVNLGNAVAALDAAYAGVTTWT